MAFRRSVLVLAVAALLASCGGGGSGGTLSVVPGGTGTTPTPTPPVSGGCTVPERQTWVFNQLQDWYLFPETLPASLDPAPFATVQAYLDALTATARAQRRDRFFTYITSIAEENAFITSGSSAGFGIRLSYDQPGRLFVAEAFEGAPALAAGIDRGTEILEIGETATALRLVSQILASEGPNGVTLALGPPDPGIRRTLRVRDADGQTRLVNVSKADYELLPVSNRYGARVIEDGGRRVGYVNLRTFGTATAEAPLRAAFLNFRQQGITDIVIDVRYNGGGLVRIAELVNDLLGGDRSTSDVLARTTYRPSRADRNTTRFFRPQPESVSPTRVAFITTGASASASELIVNATLPYLGANAGLIGTNTFGKPVGQIALDRQACDDRLRVVAFRTENARGQGDYYDGLAGVVQASCRAADDIAFPLGDRREASLARALDFIAGRPCTPIAAGASQRALSVGQERTLLQPDAPTAAQREVPGMF